MSADPDDLAAMVCAALRNEGVTPYVELANSEVGEELCFTAIEIRRGDKRGPLVATFPIQPIPYDRGIPAQIISRIGAK